MLVHSHPCDISVLVAYFYQVLNIHDVPLVARPVGLSCRIHQLHLCTGIRPFPLNEATCWPWVVALNLLGREPSG